MDNPLTYAIEKAAIKRTDLARELGVSRQFISRAERGSYVNLSSAMIDWIQQEVQPLFPDGVSKSTINRWYKMWQDNKRRETMSNLELEFPLFPGNPKGREHIVMSLQERGHENNVKDRSLSPVDIFSRPRTVRDAFIIWRRTYWATPYAFATSMCVHVASVEFFEAGKVRVMPEDLRMFFIWLEETLNGK